MQQNLIIKKSHNDYEMQITFSSIDDDNEMQISIEQKEKQGISIYLNMDDLKSIIKHLNLCQTKKLTVKNAGAKPK